MFKFKCFTIKFQNTLEVGPVSMLNEVLLKFSLKYLWKAKNDSFKSLNLGN